MSITSPAQIDAANAQALQRIYTARPYLVAVRPARELLPQFREYTILHAGPPALWEAMCGPMRGAILGAVAYEGRAADLGAGQALVEAGGGTLRPRHSLSAVGAMARIITASVAPMR